MTFTYNSDKLELLDHAYNMTILNERAVEIPIALGFISQYGIDLEVGNVLAHYGVTGHRVIDLHEEAPHVENVDILTFMERVPTIVSISTIEHVGWDQPDRDPQAAVRALSHLRYLADRLFITVPLGYNPPLDSYLLGGAHGATRASTLVRHGDEWRQTRSPRWEPYEGSAGSVFVAEWL